MATTVLDEFITRFRFVSERGDLRRVEQGTNRVLARIRRNSAAVARGVGQVGVAIGALGGAAYGVGANAERAFTRLQTQLGLTAGEAAEAKGQMEALARDTGQDLTGLANAYFSLRSNGLTAEAALDVVGQAAKGAAIELGTAADIANVAGSAINALGEERATEIILGTIKAGNIPDAASLSRSMGSLLPFAAELGISFDELGAAIAGFSRTGKPVSEVVTSVRSTMQSLLRPSSEAIKILGDLGVTTDDLKRMLADQGLIKTLQNLRAATTGDDLAFSKLIGQAEALGFALNATGDNADDYNDILGQIRGNTGDLNEAFGVVKETGFHSGESALTDLKLTLEKLYTEAVVPVLEAFNALPETVRVALAGIAVGGVTAQFLGLGGAIGGIVTALAGVGKFAAGLMLAAGPFGLIVAAAAALAAALYLYWDEIAAAWEWLENQFGEIVGVVDTVWDETAWPTITGAWEALRTSLTDIVAPVGTIWDERLWPTITGAWEALRLSLTEIVAPVGTIWDERLWPAIMADWAALRASLTESVGAVGTYWDQRLWPAIMADWDALRASLTEIVAPVGTIWDETAWPAITGAWEALRASLTDIVGAVGTIWDETAWPTITGAWEALRTSLTEIVGAVETVWDETTWPTITAAWEALRTSLGGIVEVIPNPLTAVEEGIQAVRDGIDGLKAAWD